MARLLALGASALTLTACASAGTSPAASVQPHNAPRERVAVVSERARSSSTRRAEGVPVDGAADRAAQRAEHDESDLPGPTADHTASFRVAEAVDARGRRIVTWQDNHTGVLQIYVRRHDGHTWQEVGPGSAAGGGISNSLHSSRHPAVAVDAQGHPIVAWLEYVNDGNWAVHVKRFDGQRWLELGGPSARGRGISHTHDATAPAVAFDREGRPVVAWQAADHGAVDQIHVKRFEGGAWLIVEQKERLIVPQRHTSQVVGRQAE